MNKKYLVLTILMLLVGLFAAGCATGTGGSSSGPDFGKIFDKILEAGSLKILGISGVGDNQLIGFIRIALAILIFTLIYFGLSAVPGLGEQKPIKITIAVIMALITAVFLPATILVTFGGTYAGIFAFIILGAPLAGVAWLLFATDTSSRFVAGLKFFGTCFAIWLISEISHWANKLAGTSSLIDFSGFVAQFASWAKIALWIVLIYFAFLWIKGGKGDKLTTHAVGGAKVLGEWFGNKLQNRAKRSKTRLLNEYIEEEKELKLIDEIKERQKKALNEIQAVISANSVRNVGEKSEIVGSAWAVENGIKEAINEFRRLNRRTWRQERETGKLIEKLKDKKVDVSNLEVYENKILENHKKTKEDLEKVLSFFSTTIRPFLQELARLNPSGWPVAIPRSPKDPVGNPPIPLRKILNSLNAGLQHVSLIGNIDAAETKQKEVMKDVQGIITEARELWK